MAPLPRQILLHGAGGFLVAAIFVTALMSSAAGSVLREAGAGPLLLLWLFCGGTFAVTLGAAAMAGPMDAPQRGSPVLRPVPVRARARRRGA